jgi:uncharacterized membrane protein YfcA
MQWWLAYLAIGLAVGFFAGLLGIGGGAVMVPMLVFVFTAQGLPQDHIMHIALGTAMATIMFTSISSMRAHHAHGAVDWRIARAIAPGILAGSFCAALAAGLISRRPLAVMFTALVFYAATQMLFDLRPKESRELPGPAGLFSAGAVIGAVSSLLAAGGAFLCIPFLAWCSVPLRRAIGTAAAVGLPIAAAGTLGYLLQGLRVEGLPSPSLGYVYLPALGLVVVTSMLAAPLGARVAHRLPVKRLRIVFALVLYALAIHMLTTLW